MTNCKRVQTLFVLLSCLGLVLPSAPLSASEIAPSARAKVVDIALGPGGQLVGKVVNEAGQAVPNATLVIKSGEHRVVETLADADGAFNIKSLRGGTYQITADGYTSSTRLWSEKTAPPHAVSTATIATGAVVRGQSCTSDSCTGTCGGHCDACGGLGVVGGNAPLAFLMNPIVIGAAVAAAVAIPLALDDDDDDNAS